MKDLHLSRRGFLVASAGAAATGLLGQAAFAAAPIRIGVGSDPVFVAFYMAAHEKLFAAEGVDAVLQLYADGGEAMNALVAQQVDLAAAAEPTNLVRLGRADLRPLAVVYQSGRYVKLVLGPKVKSSKDIKRFGIVPGSISEYCAGLTLAAEGLDPTTVTMVPSGPPELPALLARGDIDAFFAWEPWPANAVAQGGRVALTSKDVGYTDTIWLTASAAILKSDPAGLQGILRALAKASEIARTEPERAAAAVKAVTRIPVETSLKAFKDMTPLVRDFTPEDLKSYDGIAKFLADHKVTKEVVPYREALQIGFYKG
jgi:NitT/TauT family transport system substrate-binding protein